MAKLIKKASSLFLILNSFTTKSGDMISLRSRILNNKAWYSVILESQYNDSSYYDGENFDDAFELYIDFINGFKGFRKAEEIRKLKTNFLVKIQKLEERNIKIKYNKMYDTLKSKPLFLGLNDF